MRLEVKVVESLTQNTWRHVDFVLLHSVLSLWQMEDALRDPNTRDALSIYTHHTSTTNAGTYNSTSYSPDPW
jgi:hypothetical protein